MVTAAQIRGQISSKRRESIRVDRNFSERIRAGVKANPTAPSSKFDELRQFRQNALNKLTAEITALERLEQEARRTKGEFTPEEVRRTQEQFKESGLRESERGGRREVRLRREKLALALQSTSLSPENIKALEEARRKQGQLSQANIRALQDDIKLKGLSPEGKKLLKVAGLTTIPKKIFRRAGETTLEFRERTDPELQFSIEQTEIPQVDVGASEQGFTIKGEQVVDFRPGEFPTTRGETKAFAESEFFKDANLSSQITPLGIAAAGFAGASSFFEDFIDTTIRSKAPIITQGFIPTIFKPDDKPFGATLDDITLSKGQIESNIQQITEIRKIKKAESDFKKDVEIIQKEFQEDPESFKDRTGFISVKTEEGTTFTLEPEFFKTLPSYKEIERLQGRVNEQGFLKREEVNEGLVSARQKWKTLSKEQRVVSALGDWEVPFLQTGSNIMEFGRDVAFTFGEQFSRVGKPSADVSGFKAIGTRFTTRQLGFGSQIIKTPVSQPLKKPFTLGSIPEMVSDTPGFTVQSTILAGVAARVGGLGKPMTIKPMIITSKKVKIQTALAKTVGKIQPIRIAERDFIITDIAREFRVNPKGPGIRTIQSKEGGKITSITQGETTDVSFNLFGKKQGGIQFIGSQEQRYVNPEKSFVDFRLATPYAKIGPGGTLTLGRTTITSKGIIKTVPVSGNLFHTTGQVKITGPKIGSQTRFIDTYGGGVQTGQVGPIETFRFFSGPKVTQFIEDPRKISFLEVKPKTIKAESGFFVDVKGKGIRFNIPEDPEVRMFLGGRTRTPFSETFGSDTTQAQITQLYKQPNLFKDLFASVETKSVSDIIPGAVPGVTSPSQFGFGRGSSVISGFSSTETIFASPFVPLFQSSSLFIPTSFSFLAPLFISSDTQRSSPLAIAIPSLTERLQTKVLQIPKQDPLLGQSPGQGQPQAQIPGQKQIQIPKQIVIPKQVPVTIPRITQPTITVPVNIPRIVKFPFASEKIIKVKPKVGSGKVGYHASAKRGGKFVKLNRVPLTKARARDLMAYIVDTSLSATGRIRKAKKPAKKSNLRIPKGYYKKSAHKFRDYKKVGKGRVPLKNTFIEKKKFRLDFKKETRSIVAARKSLSKTKRRRK